jgi:predicted PurR-regulated permease PerM
VRRKGELEIFAEKVAVVVAAFLALLLLWRARDVLILIFIAAVVAAGIAPAVQRVRIVCRFWMHRAVPRGVAVGIVYLPFVLLVLLIAIVLIPRLVDETRALGAQLPRLIEMNILTPLGRYMPVGPLRRFLFDGGMTLPRASVFLYVRNTATVIASFVAVLFMIAYMLVDGVRLRNLILLFYAAKDRADRRRMLNRMSSRMSSWLSGQLVISGITGVATFIAFLFLRIPFALPLAILAAIGQFVPVIGPIVGTSPALAIALLHSRWQFWSVLALALVLSKVLSFVIAPRVMASKLNMSPLAAFIAFMIGGSLLGIVGAIMAIPMAAILSSDVRRALRRAARAAPRPRSRRHAAAARRVS